MRRFVLLFLVLSALLLPRGARADAPPPRGLLVVSAAPDATEIDIARLRADVGRELGVEAIGPDDPRAASARMRVDVSIHHATRELIVEVRGGAEPLERHVPLPSDADEVARTAVLLVGNLARDEAADLVAAMRAPKATPAPRGPAPLSPEDQQELARDERLRELFRTYAAHDKSVRLIAGISMIGVSVATGVTLFVLRDQVRDFATEARIIPLDGLIVGITWVATTSTFEKLSASYDSRLALDGPTPWTRAEAEEHWRTSARREHKLRVVLGWVGVGIGVAAAGVTTALVLADTHHTRSGDSIYAVNYGESVLLAGLGAYYLTTKSNVESRLADYERGLDRPSAESSLGFRLAPVPGGATLGIGGRF